jgi:hypothetical protein
MRHTPDMAVSIVVSILTKNYAKPLGEFEFAERLVKDAVGLDAIVPRPIAQIIGKKRILEQYLPTIGTLGVMVRHRRNGNGGE